MAQPGALVQTRRIARPRWRPFWVASADTFRLGNAAEHEVEDLLCGTIEDHQLRPDRNHSATEICPLLALFLAVNRARARMCAQ